MRIRLARLFHHPLFIIAMVLLATRALAHARPGGGGSFSGGSSSGGGGSSDDDFIFDVIILLLQITVDYPQVGIPLIILTIGVYVVSKLIKSDGGKKALIALVVLAVGGLCLWNAQIGLGVAAALGVVGAIVAIASSQKPKLKEWSTQIEKPVGVTPAPTSSARRELESLRRIDPEFSLIVLEDFLDALYIEVQHARGQQTLERWAPYVSAEARAALANSALGAVKDVIVGAMRFATADVGSDRVTAEVELETNLTETSAGKDTSYYLREIWSLKRNANARSRAPDKARVFACPNCGAALESITGGVCTYCKLTVDTGERDWIVSDVQTLARQTRGPLLTAETPETGTDLPTVVDSDLTEGLSRLLQKDPQFSESSLGQRISLVFKTMQPAWSDRDWLRVRPFMTDRLFGSLLYWVDAYKRAKLRNINEQTSIERVQMARVASDKHFDAVTVRVYASGLDYTISDDGKLICGSKTKPRRYSEYWTLIRGASARGPARSEAKCPNCGGELKVTMAGNCEFCKARVTLGEFDWVLSRIEQDEVYGE